MIVIVTPTILNGPVVRWYASEETAQYGNELVSASRNGVRIEGYLHDVPDTVLARAQEAYRVLAARGDVDHLATHRKQRYGDLYPIDAAAAPGAGA